jgi:hypothetical protein
VHIALILDDDLAFTFWLGLALHEADCPSLPARNARSARALLGRIGQPVGLLIFNPALRGAARLLQELRGRNPDLKAIAALPASYEGAIPDVEARLHKPHALDDAAKFEWVGAVRRVSGGGGAIPAR